jgi:hypothetical protein
MGWSSFFGREGGGSPLNFDPAWPMDPRPLTICWPNTFVLPGMFLSQESASKIQRVQGPLWNFHGNCDRLEGLKVDKSRFSVPYVASLVGPMNYWGQRNTFSSIKRKNKFYISFSDVFDFYNFLGQSCLVGIYIIFVGQSCTDSNVDLSI